MNNNILVRVNSYVEEGCKPIPCTRLSDKAYGSGLERFVPVCTDIVAISREERCFYLAKRRTKPFLGYCWMGGSMFANETFEESAIRCFASDTKINLIPERLTFVAILPYRWKDRQQEPQDIGCHMLGFTFIVELTEDELSFASKNLDPLGYEFWDGIRPFNRENLVRYESECMPSALELYDHIFPLVF